MKRILIMIDSLTGGGAEKVLISLLRHLNKDKYKIDILLIDKEGVYLQDIEEQYNVMSINKKRKKSKIVILRKLKSLYLIVKLKFLSSKIITNKIIPNNYDIEIAFLEGNSTKFIGNRRNNAKKIAWVHTDLKKHRVLPTRLEKKIYGNFDRIVCVSNDSAESVKELYPMHSSKINVIYNPIDTFQIHKLSQEKIDFYDRDKINVVTVGRLNYAKGYDILLQAHNRLIKEGCNHKLYILGEGLERSRLQNYIEKNNLIESVHLVGFCNNPYPYISNADIFVMSSRYEGYSLVVGEALILGKPIIATACTGPKELLDNGKYGSIVECENIDELKEALKKMIINEEIREHYSKMALERADIFNISETMNQIEDLLDII